MNSRDKSDPVSPGRRNVLRGTALAGAAAIAGGIASRGTAAVRTPYALPRIQMPDDNVVRVQQSEMARAEPADLADMKGYGRNSSAHPSRPSTTRSRRVIQRSSR